MIELRNFSIGYGRRTLLDRVAANFRKGELTALIGRNGTGKSTLLRALAGLNRRYTGEILIDGKNLRHISAGQLARTMAFVTTERTRIANLRCEDVVAIGRAPYTNWIGRLQEADREIVARSLADVGMGAYADRTMDKMSDGECQRIMIARALAQDTPAILLDEPTSFLDMPTRYELVALLRKLAREQARAGQMRALFHPRARHCHAALRQHSAARYAAAPLHAHRGDTPQRSHRAPFPK